MMRRQGVGKIRHLSIKVLWLQQMVMTKQVTIHKIPTQENKSDFGTKPHPRTRLIELKEMCDIVGVPPEVLVVKQDRGMMGEDATVSWQPPPALVQALLSLLPQMAAMNE